MIDGRVKVTGKPSKYFSLTVLSFTIVFQKYAHFVLVH